MTERGDLASAVLRGEPAAVARAISLVENDPAAAGPLLAALHPHTGNAHILGITGPPGAGKSTLVDRIAGSYRRAEHRVGVIAVDPTSPFSGGALLGDRIRMQSVVTDPGIFIRSMATRGSLGGLSHCVPDAVEVLDAAGYGRLLVETVGVGQAEVDITRTCDVCVLVLVPGMGDDVQALKAGIMEIADIFALNKSDRDGAQELRRQVEFFLSLSERRDGWEPPVVETVATENRGLDELMQAISRFQDFCEESGTRNRRRLQSARHRILELLRERLVQRALGREESDGILESWAERVVQREVDSRTAVDSILAAKGLPEGDARS